MELKKITLSNFRKFVDFELELKPGVNILIGDNATGKTSILEGLKVILGSFFYGVNSANVTAPSIIRDKDVRFSQSNVGQLERFYPTRVEAKGVFNQKEVSWFRELKTAKGRTTTTSGLGELISLIEDERSLIKEYPVLSHYSTARLHTERKQTTKYKKDDRFEGYFNSLASSSSVSRFIDWFENEDRTSYEEGVKTSALKIVSEAIENCLPEKGLTISYSAKLTQIILKDSEGNITPYNMMSDGYKLITSLIGDLAYRCAVLNAHLGASCLQETKGVVLIDEIEMHLHPSWQVNIINSLEKTFPQIQFVITTHSPVVLAGASNANVIRLSSDSSTGEYLKQKVHTVGRSIDNILYAEQKVITRSEEIRGLINKFYEFIETKETLDKAKEILDNVFIDKFGEYDPETIQAIQDYEFAVLELEEG